MNLPIDLTKLNFQFIHKPLLIGGMAMQFYGLRQVDAIPNGLDHPYDNPAIADAICYTVVDQFTLDSTAKMHGRVVAYARRVLSQDGKTMTVTQSGAKPDGSHFENVSVYRRI